MDKKKQFQIQNLKAKQATYETSLNELLQQRQQILDNIKNLDIPDTLLSQSLSSNTDNNSLNSNGNVNGNVKLNLNELYENKKLIEKQITTIKNLLSANKYDIVNTTNKIKQLPEILKANIKTEVNIYNEEITNIENLILEAELNNIQKQTDANSDKADLLNDIISIKTLIVEQNNIITDLQFNAHNSRKNTLEELHNKKQEKIVMQQQIDNINSNSKIYQEHLDKLTNANTILEQLKINIINNYYTNTNNTASTDTPNNTNITNANTNNTTESILDIIRMLIDYDIQIDLDNQDNLTNPEFTNHLVKQIDSTIENNNARMVSINNKSERAHIKNTIHIENIKNNFNNVSRNKVISFKDLYKIERQKRNDLQSKCNEMEHLYNNYNTLIISKITDEYNATILELNNHKQRADERINIMKERLNNEYEQTKTNLETQIIQIQTELSNNTKKFNDLNTQLKDIENKLANLDKSNMEIHNLDNKINQITTTINKIKNDINYFEQNI